MKKSLFHGDLVRSNRTIYTPSDFARKNLLYLQEIGELTAQQLHISQRKNLDSLLFFVVLKGKGTLEYKKIRYELSEGDCVFINCQESYMHQTSPKLWTLKWIHFYSVNANQIFKKYCQRNGKYKFKTEQLKKYTDILDEINKTANSNSFTQDMQIYSLIASLLSLIMEETWYGIEKQTASKKQKKVDEVKNFIDKQYNKKITLDTLAKDFFINKYYLSKLFKKEYDITINNYLTLVRINQAKKILRFSDKTIEEIAQMTGFEDSNYFSRVFKKKETVSPKTFRNKWQTNNS